MRTVLPNDVMCKLKCGQLHSEVFGRRHSTLQLHGLFVLAKHLSVLIGSSTAYTEGVTFADR